MHRKRNSYGRHLSGAARLRAAASVAIASAVAAGAVASGATASVSHHKKKRVAKKAWVLGSLLDQTGVDAAGGVAQKAGVTYYINQINKAGGVDGHRLKLRFCDSQSIPTAAAQCAQQLAGVNTHIVLAQTIDPSTRGALPYLGKDLVVAVDPVLLPTSSQKNVFQASGSGAVIATALVKAVKAAHLQKIGVLYTSDTSGTNQLTAAQKAAQAAGLTVVSQSQTDGATDVTPQLVQLRAQGAQVIYIASVGTNSAAAVNSYTTLGMSQPLIVGAANVTDGFLHLVSKIPPHMFGVSELLQDRAGLNRATVKAFDVYLRSFKATTHQPADTQTTTGVYDGCVAVAALRASHDKSLAALEKALRTQSISCLGSKMRFNLRGLNVINNQPASLAEVGSSPSAGWGRVRHGL